MPDPTENASPPIPSAFKIGDLVQWTEVSGKISRNRSSLSFHTAYGKILDFSKPKGLKAYVQRVAGRKTFVPVSNLRLRGARTELTEIVLGKEVPR